MRPMQIHMLLGGVALLLTGSLTGYWTGAAATRLEKYEAEKASSTVPQVAVASAADEGYCTGDLKLILRRVLTSCGLLKGGSGRGCQPLEAKNVAALSGDDFNALFVPLAERAAILQFEKDDSVLDEPAKELLNRTFSEQRGASYFFVVSRASPEGSVSHNRDLSQRRAGAVLEHLRAQFNDPDLDQEVGLLWLGEEFAQLDQEFCKWNRSHPESQCTSTELNRSAFVAWIDCKL